MALTAQTANPSGPTGLRLPAPLAQAAHVALRFVLVYLFLSNWIWLDELAVNPTRFIHPIFNAVFGTLARWTGHHLFHLTGPLLPNSFRDTPYNYLLLLVVFAASILITVLWVALDRRQENTRKAYYLLRIWLRYTLAYMILIYAMDKVFQLQFPFPSLRRLTESYGDASPMALLWSYVGYSTVMVLFSGWAEAVGGALLLFRRTAPLGALISVVMMANVALMDFCYDVSVKMLAAHFLLMGIFLLAHDAERLLAVLAFNRAVPADDQQSSPIRIGNPTIRRAMPWLKALVVLYVLVPVTWRTWRESVQVHQFKTHVPLYGLYAVKSYSVNGVDQPLLINQPKLPRYVIVQSPTEAILETMDDTTTEYPSTFDAASSQLHLRPQTNATTPVSLTLAQVQPGAFTLTGQLGPDQITAQLTPVDPAHYTLVNRGFHWINETSFSQ